MSCPFLRKEPGVEGGNLQYKGTCYQDIFDITRHCSTRLSFLGKISFKHLMNIYLLIQRKIKLDVSSVDMYVVKYHVK